MLITNAWIQAYHAAAATMDSFELFRKLGAGAKFDLKRFGHDAARFKVKEEYPFGGFFDENTNHITIRSPLASRGQPGSVLA